MDDTLLALLITVLVFAPFVVLRLLSVSIVSLRRSVQREASIDNDYWQYGE